jgi:2',3'-cyclic-nucleotide 2'-phosphodiesterase (5'-nucleotidase family)
MFKRVWAVLLAVMLLLAPAAGTLQAAQVDHTQHYKWMEQVGLLSGTDRGLELDASITKAQVVAFLQRALNWSIPSEKVAIADVPRGHWAYDPMQAAIANGVIELEQGKANPSAKLSSIEVFAIAKQAGLTLDLAPTAELSRGQFLRALGGAVSKTITVVHTNDVHGRILGDDSNGILGLARVATIVEQTRAENPNTLVLDGGDALHGTNEAQFFAGASVVNAMNCVGVDVMVPGNHDFNYGYEHLLALEQDAAFDIVSSNVLAATDGESGESLLEPYVIRELAGLKVGIFGLSSVDTPTLTHPKNVVGLTFVDPIATAAAMVEDLADADCIIALTHVGHDIDRQLADSVPEIDLIIGGHSHTEVLDAEKVNQTYIAQTGEHTKNIGREHLVFYQGELVGVFSDPVSFDETIAVSPRANKLIQTVHERVQKEMQAVIGTATTLLDGVRENVRAKETNLGNLIADVMRASTGADVAMTNGGGIRASIAPGEITINDVVTVLPFGNTLSTIKLTGEQLLAVLEHSVRLYPATNGGFMQVSGLTFSFDPSLPEGERVVEVKVGGVKLDPAAVYTVATNDFLAAGGDGYTAFAEGTELVDTGISLDIVLMEYIQQQGSVGASVDGRITVIGE